MLHDDVKDAVARLDKYFGPGGGVMKTDWPEVRSRLEVQEAEIAGYRTLLDLLRTGRNGEKYVYVESRAGTMVSITANLHEQGNENG